MNIKGPIKITVEGPCGSGKSRITDLLKQAFFYHNIEWMQLEEGQAIPDRGQTVSIIEKQS